MRQKKEGLVDPESTATDTGGPPFLDSNQEPRAAAQTGATAEADAVVVRHRRPSIVKSAGIISGAVMISRILGLAREVIFAYFFGASKSFAYDAYVIAFRIPNMLRALFAEGALSAAFVTVFSDYLVTKDKDAARRLSNITTTALVLVLGALVILGVLFTPAIVGTLAPGYLKDPEKFRLTVKLTRIMMPYILLVALAAKAMGLLNACDRFGIPALSSSFFNIGSIVGGLLLAAYMADSTLAHPIRAVIDHPVAGIVGMASGVLIGGLLQYLIQWPSLRQIGFRYTPVLGLADPGLRRLIGLFVPAVIGAAAVQVNVVVNSNFASTIPGNGPVSWLSYAFRLMQFPMGLFGVSIATATLPSISRSAAVADIAGFRHTLAASLRLGFLATIPSAVGLVVLARPIIALIYQRGDFGARDTDHTAGALACYAIGLAGYAGTRLMAPAFYALNDGRTPMLISLASIVTNLALNWILVGPLQERGLALSTSLVAISNFAALYWVMSRRIGGVDGRANAAAMARIALASGLMGLVCWGCWYLASTSSMLTGTNFLVRAVAVIGCVGTGAGTFYVAAYTLGVRELQIASIGIKAAVRKMLRSS